MHKPKISVIIPIYNGERYLNEAIGSVLAQTYCPIEIIVVDDGSTDSSAQIVKRFSKSVQYFFQTNSGTGAARNQGINLATGGFFAFLDQDDVWVEDKLARQMAVFITIPETDIVFGYVKQFHSPEVEEHVKQKIHCPARLMPGYAPSAMLIKRSAFFRVGLFETKWKIGEWADWYVRALELKLKRIMLQDLITLRRLHKGNKGLRQSAKITEYVQMLRASLDPRRTKLEGKIPRNQTV
jgi:glycosyltransferase involved in cell wall biosynthesis